MFFDQALNLKKQIASSLFLKKKKPASKVISFAAGTRAGALSVETDLQTSVNGVGIGTKPDGSHLVKLYTRENLTVSTGYLSQYYGLDKQDLVVEKVGRITFKNPTARHRPPYPGISAGHYKITAGTLGCFVKNNKGQVHILSNNHVLANNNDSLFNDPILQPGPLDGGSRRKDRIAGLTYYVPLEHTKENEMDAAIALVDNGVSVNYSIGGAGTIKGVGAPAHRMQVEKYGRTTGHTTGSVTTLNVDLQVDFDGVLLDFIDQFEIKGGIKNGRRTMFCDGGDSGSLILEKGRFTAIGLLFAGNDEGTTFATPINEVLKAFSVSIL